MDVTFEVTGQIYAVPAPQATLMAEKLRLFAKGEFPADAELVERLGANPDWRAGARAVADFVEEALIDNPIGPLPLEGNAAEAMYWVLRLTMDTEPNPTGAAGMQVALGELLGY